VTVVAVLGLLVALVALALAAVATRRAATVARRPSVQDLPDDVHGLRAEVAALRLDSADALRHLAVVRYDAFGDTGGQLSWSAALLDDHGNGVVLTAIHGRNDTRTYAKSIAAFDCDQPLSPEEADAIAHARPRSA
jgi:hypothetical protein